MTPPRRRGRRIPPKGTGQRPAPQPLPGPAAGASSGVGAGSTGAGAGGGDAAAERARQLTRAQNRAAKRAASGVRPKAVRGGRVSGGRNRGYNPAVLGLAIAAVIVVAAVFLIGNPLGGASPSPSASGQATQGAVASHGDGTCPTSQPASLAAGETHTVTIATSLGNIVIKVDGSLAPIAAGNFVALVQCRFYDGIVFHRTPTLDDGTPFVIQGGDPNGDGSGGPGYTIADDPVTTTYRRGTVAMARTSAPNSQGSQFFIVLDDKSAEPLANANTYAIFGEVINGMEVADAIYQASNGEELPLNPIVMTSVTLDEPAASASPGSTSESAAPAATQ